LQLASLSKRDCKLLLKLVDVGAKLVGAAEVFPIVEMDDNKQSDQRRDEDADPEIHDRLGHDATL
jgi:hypothetical protein